MERQQGSLRTALNTADTALADYERRQVLPSWAVAPIVAALMPEATDSLEQSAFREALLAHAPRMNFFQFCLLLDQLDEQRQRSGGGLGSLPAPTREPVRFKSVPTLGFPAGEIARVEQDAEPPQAPPTVRTTFFGLYGVDAVLPYHFLDDISTRREGWEPLADFLDLFHHRLSTLYYRAWRKYRYPVVYQPGADDALSRSLLGLIGLGIGEAAQRQQVPAGRLLGLLGLASQRTRPAEGMIGIICHVVPQAQVEVEEFVPRWVTLDAPFALQKPALALKTGNLVLGQRMRDATRTVRVVICPAWRTQLAGLLPGGEDHRDLFALLQVYLGHKLDAELLVEVPGAWLTPMGLQKNSHTRLGLTSALGSQQGMRRLRIGRYQAFVSH